MNSKNMRKNEQDMRQAKREIGRNRVELEREEQKLIAEIKRAAKGNNQDLVKSLAKNLITVRKYIANTYNAQCSISSMGSQQKVMASTQLVAQTMAQVAKISQGTDIKKTISNMKEFQKQNMQMAQKEEMMNDVLADIFEEDASAEDAVVNQVLDELGIETNSKLSGLPSIPSASASSVSNKQQYDDDFEARLASLLPANK